MLEINCLYEFKDFRLDAAEKVLRRGGEYIAITPKVFETLCVLVENAGRIIEKDELMQKIWQDRFVEESNLTFNVKMLRKALGDSAGNPTFIETVPRRGYRFIADVKKVSGGANETGANKFQISDEPAINRHTVKLNGHDSMNGDATGEKSNGENSAVKPPPTVLTTRPRIILFSLLAIGIAVSSLTGLYLSQRKPTYFERFGSVGGGSGFLKVEKLSDTGNLDGANISPDGKMIVYIADDSGRSVIWLRQIGSGKSVPLLTATDETLFFAAFSGDGEYVNYAHHRQGEPLTMSRVSTLGGSPTKIISGMHNGWTTSPDGTQIAFARYDKEGSHLILANADGGEEREIFLSPKPRYMFSLNWSPDGKSIAYCISTGRFDSGAADYGVYEFDLAAGAEKPLSDLKWSFIENIRWLPDRSGMLITARENVEDTNQIWRISLTEEKAAPITNDSADLGLRSASTDFKRILAIESTLATRVYVVPRADLAAVRPLAKAEISVAWTADGRIIFPSKDTVKTDLWAITGSGGDKKQLTANDSLEQNPAASPDGRYIAYISTRGGQRNVWRMDADGGNQTRLTNGEGENFPTFTPDGNWVVYNSIKTGSLWKIPVAGGAPEQISAEKQQRAAVSPDGKKYVCSGFDQNKKLKLFVKSFPEGDLLREFELSTVTASPMKVVWTNDGKSLIYESEDKSYVGNLWRQPLVGGAPEKLTDFTSEQMFDFAVAPDESQIAFVRGAWNVNAVLLTGFE